MSDLVKPIHDVLHIDPDLFQDFDRLSEGKQTLARLILAHERLGHSQPVSEISLPQPRIPATVSKQGAESEFLCAVTIMNHESPYRIT